LNVFPISLPPLRERREDILPLAAFFLSRYATLEKKSCAGFSIAAEHWMMRHPWPGNVRELEHCVYRAVLLCDGRSIALEHLRGAPLHPDALATPPELPDTRRIALFHPDGSMKTLDTLREEIIRAALIHHQHRIAATARALCIGKSTLYRHLEAERHLL
jgi:DNA-binding NtrC family response regulator